MCISKSCCYVPTDTSSQVNTTDMLFLCLPTVENSDLYFWMSYSTTDSLIRSTPQPSCVCSFLLTSFTLVLESQTRWPTWQYWCHSKSRRAPERRSTERISVPTIYRWQIYMSRQYVYKPHRSEVKVETVWSRKLLILKGRSLDLTDERFCEKRRYRRKRGP